MTHTTAISFALHSPDRWTLVQKKVEGLRSDVVQLVVPVGPVIPIERMCQTRHAAAVSTSYRA